MQIINNTGAIIKEQINLGDIDNLNIDDLFKNNTNNKKMKNNNYPNWLVSLEIAKKLKEIGFKEKCLCYWHEYFHRIECSTDDEERLCPEYYDYNTDESTTSLPTWEQVFEWFRGKGMFHSIRIVNDLLEEVKYFETEICDNNGDIICMLSRVTYEEVREALVKALIQTYKSEQL